LSPSCIRCCHGGSGWRREAGGNLERLNRLMRVVGGKKDRVVGCKPWLQGRGGALLDRGRWWLRTLMGGRFDGMLLLAPDYVFTTNRP